MCVLRRASMAAKRKAAQKKEAPSLMPLYVGGGVLVIGLISLVWWSVSSNQATASNGDDGGVVETPSSTSRSKAEDAAPRLKNQIERPPRASAELAIITSKTEEEITAIATVSEIAKRLEARHCGSAC